MKIAVIGGGAAGFFGAVTCASEFPEHTVILLEKSSKLLSKVLVSGGGRCNVTHACFDPRQLVSYYPRGSRELLGAFNRFQPGDTVNWFRDRGVRLKTEEDGRMFPVTDSSETIAQCLLTEAEKLGVVIKLKAIVRSIEKRDGNGFYINLEGGRIEADRILVATGGSPKEEAYSWLKATGHSIISPVPSLFTFNINDKTLHELAGVSVKDTWIKLNGSGFSSNGPLLITHWGMSGPVVLKLSAWAARYLNEKKYDFSFSVNWLPGLKEQDLKEKLESLRQISRPVEALSPFAALPLRLWKYLCLKARIPSGMKWPEISRKDFNRLVQELGSAQFASSGKTTYKEEFVTSGGVNLKEVDFRTMQSKKCEGLFFAGEVLDIDAVTGGFNFQSAWTTGWIAGKAIGA